MTQEPRNLRAEGHFSRDFRTVLAAQYVFTGDEHQVLRSTWNFGSIEVLFNPNRSCEPEPQIELSPELVIRISDLGRANKGFWPTALLLPHDADEAAVDELCQAAEGTLVSILRWSDESHRKIDPVQLQSA